ncbi:DinB family protein [Bacillus sp. HMF5848]|uniref:DinB family protein n=1 Tax=Bacillus sp. HMF5848 TaxID=2495421 RepID=UPI00163AA6BB|nr:DinB family protein [Bacillus sp. HMF5848]
MPRNLLKEARENLLESVEGVNDTVLNKKPSEDSWSIAQVLRHLIDTEAMVVTQLKKAILEESEKVEDKPLQAVASRKHKVKTPYDPPTDYIEKATLINNLHESRQQLLLFLDEADEQSLDNKSMKHPAFGAVNLRQMIEFIGYHEERHTDQIEEIKQLV